jgi:hypothetical protein
MITTFPNVLISIEADSPEEAYKLLARKLNDMNDTYNVEYTTDTYTVSPADESIPGWNEGRSTFELMPI